MIAVPTVAPRVTNKPSTGPNSTPLPAARIGAGHEDRAERRRHHDIGQRRGGTRCGDRAPDILHVDHACDCHQIEQPEQERSEHGEAHDVASSGGGGHVVVVGHAGSDSSARRVGSVAMTGDDRVGLSGSPDGVPHINDWNRLLDGKVAVVTGGGDGIGAGIARLFAQHGALVEVAEIDRERADRIRDRGDRRWRTHQEPCRRRHPRRRRRPAR